MTAKYRKTLTILLSSVTFSLSAFLHAGSPVWTLTPLTATSIFVPVNGTAIIQYQVTNQSKKSHTLKMTGITGISQDTSGGRCASPFTLAYQESCTLSLTVDGSALQGNVVGGPVLCQSGNALQCYQPSSADALNITALGATTLSSTVTTATPLGLSVNNTTLNAALTGSPRLITIRNTGSNPAVNVTYTPSPSLPTGTTISPSSCDTIAPAGQCILTITPGNTPSATPGNTSPTPITLTISGTNTNTVTSPFNVLTYGSVYQGGYIYAVDDTTPNTGSIGGAVVTQTDQAPPDPYGVVWSSNGAGSAQENVSEDIIPGIAATSTTGSSVPTYSAAQASFNSTYSNCSLFPFPSSGSFSSCNGRTDGACNSANILTLYNTYVTNYGISYTLSAEQTTASYYAAGLCTATISGYSDWYLPAICEMGPASNGSGSGCGASTQSIVSQLPELLGNPNSSSPSTSCTYGANCLAGLYWSSTEDADIPLELAWYQFFASGGISGQLGYTKHGLLGVRCSRALTR
jgi:hypothetical protein